MSGRIGKWSYAIIEYDLAYESLKSMKGQVVADFIVEHQIDNSSELDISYIIVTPWTLYFHDSVFSEGQGIDIILVSPSNVNFDFSSRLKNYCTNNQAEYALLFSLEFLDYMRVTHVNVLGDSQLVAQQISRVSVFGWHLEWLSWKVLGHNMFFWQIWHSVYI
jgi:hypothetical protein